MNYLPYGIATAGIILASLVLYYFLMFESVVLDYDLLYADPEIGLYSFEFNYEDDVFLYTVLGGNHVYYYMTRAAVFDENETRIGETMLVRNEVDDPLVLDVIERHSESEDRAFSLEFVGRSDEIREVQKSRTNELIFKVLAFEIAIAGGIIGSILILKKRANFEQNIQDELNEIGDDSDLSDLEVPVDLWNQDPTEEEKNG